MKETCEIIFKDAVYIIPTTKQRLKQRDYLKKGEIPIVDQGQDIVGGYTNDTSKIINCKLPVIVFGDHTKTVKFINFQFASGADGTKVLQPKKHILPSYLSYITEFLVFRIIDKGYARHYQYIEKEKFPLNSISEQRAIVAKIEELFSSLDSGIADLTKAQKQLVIYRQAVLKKAFEGHNEVQFDQIISSTQNGISKRKGVEGDLIKVLRLADIKNLKIDNSNPRTIQLNEDEVNKYKLNAGDLIIIRVNGSINLVGRFIHVSKKDESELWAFCDHFIRITLDLTKCHSTFYYYFFQLSKVRKFINHNMVSSAGQNTVSQTTIKSIFAPLLPLDEQHQIVREIESRLSVCDKVEESIVESLEKAKALRQSILKKAFEGKLLSEEEIEKCKREKDYEPAHKLLERIKEEKKK